MSSRKYHLIEEKQTNEIKNSIPYYEQKRDEFKRMNKKNRGNISIMRNDSYYDTANELFKAENVLQSNRKRLKIRSLNDSDIERLSDDLFSMKKTIDLEEWFQNRNEN